MLSLHCLSILFANNAIEHQKVFYGLAEKMLPVVLSLLLKTDTNNFETGRLFTITRKNVNNSCIFL